MVGDVDSVDKTLVGLDLGAGNGPGIMILDAGCGSRCVVGRKGEHEGGSATFLVDFGLRNALAGPHRRTRWSKD